MLIYVVPSVVLGLLALFAFIEVRNYYSERAALIDNLESIIDLQSAPIADALWEYDDEQIKAIFYDLGRVPSIHGAALYDMGNDLIYEVGAGDVPPASPDFRAEITLAKVTPRMNEDIGRLVISVHDGVIRQSMIETLTFNAFTIIFAALVLVGAVSVALHNQVTNPMKRFSRAVDQLARADFENFSVTQERLHRGRSDEVGKLAESIDHMANQLADSYKSLEDKVILRTNELKSTNEQLGIANETAEAAVKAKSAFLAAMSHEIRTPMNGVIGMVDLLTQTKLDTDQRQMLGTVRDSGHSLLTIINDILDFSKIEAGKLDIEAVDMALVDVVEGASQTMAPNAAMKGVKLLTFVDPDIAQFKKGDPTRVRQIIINMGGNAIKFSDAGKEVLIRVEKVGHNDNGIARIRFSIIDQGIGISEEAQANLFQEFSQADASTTRKFGGTGLGLAICKRLTELMGGEIGVTSVVGDGSTFWCELPFGASDKVREERKVGDLSGLRILVVSPSESYRDICRSYLTHWNADVEVTTDIEECLQRSQAAQDAGEPIDIIVIPDLDDHTKVADARKAFLDKGLMPYPRFVIGEDPRKKGDILKDIEEVTMMDINPMRRAGMLTAVAIAAGRASPEVYHQEEIEVIQAGRTPTVEEALEQGKLILLAEDNATNQLVIRKQLNTLGYQCEIANDGKEAFEMWQAKPYCILLTDCHMPEWDGFELTDAIRKSEESTDKRAPIVAITANALQGEAERCIAAGMDDYMSKPVEMKTLKQTLVKWMGEGSVDSDANDGAAIETLSEVQASTQDPETSSCPIDDRMLKDMFGDDDEMFKEILQGFVDPSETIVADLMAAYGARSAESVKDEAHKLKSSSRSVGANELADTCMALEAAGKDEDWATIDEMAPKLEPLFKEVKGYVKSL